MANTWPGVPLGKVMTPVHRAEAPFPGRVYRQVGVRLWGEGTYEREPVDGALTRYGTLFRVEAGDIIVNKIWARNGSVAVVSTDLAGTYVSSEFPTFVPIPDKLDPRWFHCITKTRQFWAQCDDKSRGTSGKNRIKPEAFLAIEVALPPVAEQRRILGRIEELAAKIEEARGLQNAALRQGEALCRSMLFHAAETTLTPMRDLVRLRETDVNVTPHETYQFAGVYSFGRGMFRGRLRVGSDFAYRRLTRLRAGNFTYPKLMAWEGALSIVPPEYEGFVVSPEFPVFEIDTSRVLEETLDTYFRTPSVWPEISASSTGTNVRRRRLHPETFLQYKFPLPSMESQQVLRDMRRRVDGLKHLQSQAQAELDALLPSVLDAAFRGEF